MANQVAAKRVLVVLTWIQLSIVLLIPIVEAAMSPLQGGRNFVYVVGGLAGVVALTFLLLQPLLAAGYMPGLNQVQGMRWHRWVGSVFVIAVVLHIGGLFVTSPADTTDALLLVAPTAFSVFGVIGLWSIVLTVALVVLRTRLELSALKWKITHNVLALVVVIASVVHSLMIDGAMGDLSKLILCVCILMTTAGAMLHLRVLKPMANKR